MLGWRAKVAISKLFDKAILKASAGTGFNLKVNNQSFPARIIDPAVVDADERYKIGISVMMDEKGEPSLTVGCLVSLNASNRLLAEAMIDDLTPIV